MTFKKKSLKKKSLKKKSLKKKSIKKKSIKKSSINLFKKKKINKKMNNSFGSTKNKLGVISDIEGKWESLKTYAGRSNSVLSPELLQKFYENFEKITDKTISSEEITKKLFSTKEEEEKFFKEVLYPSCKFVFLGDLLDNGPDNIKLLVFFMCLKKHNPDNVILIAGNRDINKLRLYFIEYQSDYLRIKDWDDVWEKEFKSKYNNETELEKKKIIVLKFIFEKTMGASSLFVNLQKELNLKNDQEVYNYFSNQFLQFVKEYLKFCKLVEVDKETGSIFVHGGIGNSNYLKLYRDSSKESSSLENWIQDLDKDFQEDIQLTMLNELLSIIRYCEPKIIGKEKEKDVWGKGSENTNDTSVIHLRPWGNNNNLLPIDSLEGSCFMSLLHENGINKMFVGHSPVGKLPVMIKKEIGKDYFYKVMCDTSAEPSKYTGTISVTKDLIEIKSSFFCDDKTCETLEYTSDDKLVGRRFHIGKKDYWIISKFGDVLGDKQGYICGTWFVDKFIIPTYLLIFDGKLSEFLDE